MRFTRYHLPSLAIGVFFTLILVAAMTYVPATASNLQQAGQTVTVTGYATQYVDDDEFMFTDGSSTVKVEVENGKASQVPLNTPVTITAQIKEQEGNKFEVNLISVEKVGEGTKVETGLPVTTVADIQAKPVDDQRVVVRGQITQHIGGEKYLFTDGTGTMVLEIDKSVPASSVSMNTPLTIFGEVDIDDGKVEIDVKGMQPA